MRARWRTWSWSSVVVAALVASCREPTVPADGGQDASAPIDAGAPDGGAPDAGGCAEPDVDGDGARSPRCGGNDCDDDDPTRFPGAAEVCDPDDHDEDCDGSTFGVRDADGDGYADAACCNVPATGEPTCGTDCDDASAAVHPSEAESCDARDNDCDGAVDETLLSAECRRDADGDGAGGTETMSSCGACPSGWVGPGAPMDCDDDDARVHPAQTMLFATARDGGGFDYDCDGATTREHDYEAIGCYDYSPALCPTYIWDPFLTPPACGEMATRYLCDASSGSCQQAPIGETVVTQRCR